MAQTTGAMSGVNARVAVSADGIAWLDISGATNQITAPDQRRASGEAYTFDGDTAVVTAGKLEPVEVALRALYTTQALEAWQQIRGFFEAVGGNPIWLRWSPGGALGSRRFECRAATVTRFTYPGADASDASPLPAEFAFRCKGIASGWVGGADLSEIEALLMLYGDLGGDGWTDNTNWCTDEEVSTWYGVTVSGGHVTALDLSSNGLSGELSEACAAGLPHLASADLSDNALTAPEVDAIVESIYSHRLLFLPESPELNVGGNNAAPTGAVQAPAPCPPASAGEMVYDLAYDTCGSGHNLWTVIYDGANQVPA